MTTGPDVHLRPAAPNDCWRLWEWRNDRAARRASLDARPIDRADHAAWFTRRLPTLADDVRVVEVGTSPIGYVRFDPAGPNEVAVSIALAPEYRGLGYGTQALAIAVPTYAAAHPGVRLIAVIRTDNYRSVAVFRRAGFALTGAQAPSADSVEHVVMWWAGPPA